MVRICPNIVFLFERFLNLLKWLLLWRIRLSLSVRRGLRISLSLRSEAWGLRLHDWMTWRLEGWRWCEALFLDLEFRVSGAPLGKFWVSEESQIFKEKFWNSCLWMMKWFIYWRFFSSDIFFNMLTWFCFTFSMTLSNNFLRLWREFSGQNFYFRRL